MSGFGKTAWAFLLACLLQGLLSDPAWAEAQESRFTAGGYFRIMARPDLEGGWGRLGLWNISGRLLNEGPWGALELKLDVLPPDPGRQSTWASVHAKLEGGSVQGADANNGRLDQFALTQLYVKAGNVLLERVVWQLGTLQYYYGDLGLYDMRPAELFFETVGLSAFYQGDAVDFLVGVGDSGFFVKGAEYNAVLTAGMALRWRINRHFELGLGGQLFFEPQVRGNRNAPHHTELPEGLGYEDFWRGEVAKGYLELFPGQEAFFPQPTARSAWSAKGVFYLGFGGFSVLRWNNLFANVIRSHPQGAIREEFQGRSYELYIRDFTDERYQVNVGNETHLSLIEGVLDAAVGLLFGLHVDCDNRIAASEYNRLFGSAVVRVQHYLTETLHLLLESSLALEHSKNGNLWRAHHDSIFESNDGLADSRGLQFGDVATRRTWQLKGGFVLNPAGRGIFSRPSIRLLYGLQHSNMHNAFGNGFVETLEQMSAFAETRDRHWHSVIALEAEAWF